MDFDNNSNNNRKKHNKSINTEYNLSGESPIPPGSDHMMPKSMDLDSINSQYTHQDKRRLKSFDINAPLSTSI